MFRIISGIFALGSTILAVPVLAAEEWKDGVLFTEEQIATLEGHTAYKIVFGLQPGKCTGSLTTVGEWLKMREGTLTQTYPDQGAVERAPGSEWYHPTGTQVEVCNRSDKDAVLIGVQFRPG